MEPLKKMLLRKRMRITARVITVVVLLVISVWLMSKAASSAHPLLAFPSVLLSMTLLLLAAIVMAPSLARALVDKVADFFMFSEKFDRPPPMYGRPAALRKSHQYEEAMKSYEEIAGDYPDEIKPYLEMIDIAQRDLNDPERAEFIYQQGVLKFEGEEDRERLARRLSGLSLRS